jgi:hypothetical protein
MESIFPYSGPWVEFQKLRYEAGTTNRCIWMGRVLVALPDGAEPAITYTLAVLDLQNGGPPLSAYSSGSLNESEKRTCEKFIQMSKEDSKTTWPFYFWCFNFEFPMDPTCTSEITYKMRLKSSKGYRGFTIVSSFYIPPACAKKWLTVRVTEHYNRFWRLYRHGTQYQWSDGAKCTKDTSEKGERIVLQVRPYCYEKMCKLGANPWAHIPYLNPLWLEENRGIKTVFFRAWIHLVSYL